MKIIKTKQGIINVNQIFYISNIIENREREGFEVYSFEINEKIKIEEMAFIEIDNKELIEIHRNKKGFYMGCEFTEKGKTEYDRLKKEAYRKINKIRNKLIKAMEGIDEKA